jgi:hypothetical protein
MCLLYAATGVVAETPPDRKPLRKVDRRKGHHQAICECLEALRPHIVQPIMAWYAVEAETRSRFCPSGMLGHATTWLYFEP